MAKKLKKKIEEEIEVEDDDTEEEAELEDTRKKLEKKVKKKIKKVAKKLDPDEAVDIVDDAENTEDRSSREAIALLKALDARLDRIEASLSKAPAKTDDNTESDDDDASEGKTPEVPSKEEKKRAWIYWE